MNIEQLTEATGNINEDIYTCLGNETMHILTISIIPHYAMVCH